jgi:hypothetical protein
MKHEIMIKLGMRVSRFELKAATAKLVADESDGELCRRDIELASLGTVLATLVGKPSSGRGGGGWQVRFGTYRDASSLRERRVCS